MVANSIVICIYKTGAHNLSSDGWEQRTIFDANGVGEAKGRVISEGNRYTSGKIPDNIHDPQRNQFRGGENIHTFFKILWMHGCL